MLILGFTIYVPLLAILVHVLTEKGRGYPPAEDDDEKHLHDAPVFDPAVGPPKAVPTGYTQAFAEAVRARPNLALYYSGWGEPFQAAFAQAAYRNGAAPFIDIDPTRISLAAIAGGLSDAYRHQSAGHGNVSAYLMISFAVYGSMIANTAAGASVAIERALGWSRQLRLTPLNPLAYMATKVLTAMVIRPA